MINIAHIRKFLDDHLDPDGMQPIQAIRTMVAGALALLLYHFLNWPQSYWILFAAIFILQTYMGDSVKEKFITLFFAGFVTAVGCYLASILSPYMILIIPFLFLTTFITLYLNALKINIYAAGYFANIFYIIAAGLPVSHAQSLERFWCILIGTGIALLVCFCLWPERLQKNIRRSIVNNLERLSEFNKMLTDKRTPEATLTIRRNRVMRNLQQARTTLPSSDVMVWNVLHEIEHLYETLLSLGQLKIHIDKQKVLKILSKELQVFSRRITWFLKITSRNLDNKKPLPSIQKLMMTLAIFEKIYQRHLQSFNEDQLLAFAVYIDDMHKLEKILLDLLALIQQRFYLP